MRFDASDAPIIPDVPDVNDLLKWVIGVIGAFGTGAAATLAVLRFRAEQRHVSTRLQAWYYRDDEEGPYARMEAALFNQGRRVHLEKIRVEVGDYATTSSADKPEWIETGQSVRRSYSLDRLLFDADQAYEHFEDKPRMPRKGIERVAVVFEDGEGHVHRAIPDRTSTRRLKAWAEAIRKSDAEDSGKSTQGAKV